MYLLAYVPRAILYICRLSIQQKVTITNIIVSIQKNISDCISIFHQELVVFNIIKAGAYSVTTFMLSFITMLCCCKWWPFIKSPLQWTAVSIYSTTLFKTMVVSSHDAIQDIVATTYLDRQNPGWANKFMHASLTNVDHHRSNGFSF